MISKEEVFQIRSKKEFEKIALKVFRFQFDENPVYQRFCTLLKKDKNNVKQLLEIPFLPIQFFKSHTVLSSQSPVEEVFTSSGTSSLTTNAVEIIRSKHFVTDISIYEKSYQLGFSEFYGTIENYCVLALLPSYLERDGSSLIYMVNDLIQKSNHEDSGFYLDNFEELHQKIKKLHQEGQTILLIGVTFALLDFIDFATNHAIDLKKFGNSIILMETGGMKGKRKELIREELHQILSDGFGVSKIHSEYGMTELLSQAYSMGDGIFECPPWMKIIIRDSEDALTYLENGKSGGVCVIDLANINSCSFIATQDLGRKYNNESFEILGRFDYSDIRGCNLMVV